jgi:sugar phosphate isomerase/epimerase
MKLAFSNLAWEKSQENEAAEILRQGGVAAVEIAPGKIWADPSSVSKDAAQAYRSDWESRGLPLVAMQALLFGHPELVLFGEPSARHAMLEYLGKIFTLAHHLGTRALVFGSPGNRKKGNLEEEKAWEIATGFFREVGRRAANEGVVVCLEANAREYGCDFITTTEEAAALVARVDSPGFQLHLDWGCMELAQEEVLSQVSKLGSQTHHLHLSSFRLQPIVDRKRTEVQKLLAAFPSVGGPRYASVEMLNPTSDLKILQSILTEISPCFEGR